MFHKVGTKKKKKKKKKKNQKNPPKNPKPPTLTNPKKTSAIGNNARLSLPWGGLAQYFGETASRPTRRDQWALHRDWKYGLSTSQSKLSPLAALLLAGGNKRFPREEKPDCGPSLEQTFGNSQCEKL